MATMKPSHVIVCANLAELVKLRAYLDLRGYTIGGPQAKRTEKGLTVTIAYPDWLLDLSGV